MNIEQSKTGSRRPLVFLGVGLFNTVIDFATYTLLTSIVMKQDNQIALAGIISGTIALACAFGTHSFITWKGTNISKSTACKFLAFTGFGMWVLRPLLLSLFIHFSPLYNIAHRLSTALHLPFSYDFVSTTGAFGFMIIILLIYNYATYDRFVFNK